MTASRVRHIREVIKRERELEAYALSQMFDRPATLNKHGKRYAKNAARRVLAGVNP